MCTPLVDFLHAVRYSSNYADGANFDRTNFQYLLRGLLVHLDDASAEIQQAATPTLTLTLTLSLTLTLTLTPHPSPSPFQAVLAVLEEAVAVDASVLADEVRAVRERHRSTKLCDALLQRAQEAGAGQLV